MPDRAPGSTVRRMVENAMNIMNIEVETGWSRAEIIDLAKEAGFGLNAANQRFQRVAKPKPAPLGIVRHTEAAEGVDTETSAGAEVTGQADAPQPDEVPRDSTARTAPALPDHASPDLVAAYLAFFQAFTDLLRLLPTPQTVAPKPAAPRPNGGSSPQLTAGATQSQIRDWARSRGIAVNPRGSVSREVREAYAAAHRDVAS